MKRINKRIYLDHASATPLCAPVVRAYGGLSKAFGNPGALHAEGVFAEQLLNDARAGVARLLEVKPPDVRFVSGGTEANNIALLGTLRALHRQHTHVQVITTHMEHSSVLEPLRFAQKEYGTEIIYLVPNKHGSITVESLMNELTEHTHLVSIGIANNETGVIQPIKALTAVIKAHHKNCIIHTDAGQVHLHDTALPHSLGVDLMSIGSGKLYGPRGIGALYVRRGTPIEPLFFGGGHEEGLRSGTENVVGAVGFGVACAEVLRVRVQETSRLSALSTFLETQLKKHGGIINGDTAKRLPHITNVSFRGIDAEYLVAYLDARGFALATKSACSERAGEKVSHVVQAMCHDDDLWRAQTSLRISMGRSTKKTDITKLLTLLPEALLASTR